jgi:hypothetical protein
LPGTGSVSENVATDETGVTMRQSRRLQIQTFINDFTKESILIEPFHTLTGDFVADSGTPRN